MTTAGESQLEFPASPLPRSMEDVLEETLLPPPFSAMVIEERSLDLPSDPLLSVALDFFLVIPMALSILALVVPDSPTLLWLTKEALVRSSLLSL